MITVDDRAGCAVFGVRVSPGAARTRALGEHAGALKLAVAAPPERGKANAAVIEFIADALGVRKADVEILSGETSRDKRVAVRGLDRGEVSDKLSALAAKRRRGA